MCELFTLAMFILNSLLAYDYKKMKYQEAKEEDNWRRRNGYPPEIEVADHELKIYRFPDDKPSA